MGHAWCKDRTSKAQDSKSPLDRVFVRCAHRIYPSLKEEGSVLGGATQRVTSSEIGYAGSPPREALTRGRSIDSVDRPFHPSDWVDVNLEVPSTPRASSVVTNLTTDTSLCPATSPTSSCSNLKDTTPVAPPRTRKKNRGRPLPPKPDEASENSRSNLRCADQSEEPLYSSVKSPKTSGDEQDDDVRDIVKSSGQDSRRTKEIYEHKVNGTGKVISSEVVSGKRTSSSEERKALRSIESNHQQRKPQENDEYERFVRNQSVKDSSTPNREDRTKSKDLDKQIKDSASTLQDAEQLGSNTRPKNYSTVSLPNYDELEVARHSSKQFDNKNEETNEKPKPMRPVRCSTVSLPAENCLSPFSEKTSVRLEDYIPNRGSTENLSAYRVLGKLDCTENGVIEDGFVKYDPSKLEDWDLSDIGNCESNQQRRLSYEFPSLTDSIDEKPTGKGEDVVDFVHNVETGESERKNQPKEEISNRYVTRSPVALQKPEAFGKAASPILEDNEREGSKGISDSNGSHLRFYEPPKLADTCGGSPACIIAAPMCREPFFLDEEKQRSALDTIGGGSTRNGAIAEESDRLEQSRMIFGRSLSNESEPFDEVYESKELRDHSIVTSKLIKTISEESLPREMLEDIDRELDDFFDEKLVKDVQNKLKQDLLEQKPLVKTPPPTPEPKIKAEILENDHSTLLKVLKEEAAEESNLSSMTPSLTELEAALSDMLEKEEPQDAIIKHESKTDENRLGTQSPSSSDKPFESEIVPIKKNFKDTSEIPLETMEIKADNGTGDKILVDDHSREELDETSTSSGQIFEDRKLLMKGRKVSFCAWEENRMAEIDLKDDPEFIGQAEDLDKSDIPVRNEDRAAARNIDQVEISRTSVSMEDTKSPAASIACNVDLPPEKPSRLHRNLEDLPEHTENVPTPPRRKNKSSVGLAKKEIDTAQMGTIDSYPDDRLI